MKVLETRCSVCGRLVKAEVVRQEEDVQGYTILIARCPACGAEFPAAYVKCEEPTSYTIPLGGQGLTERFKQVYKLLEHARFVLGELEARLRELEHDLREGGASS